MMHRLHTRACVTQSLREKQAQEETRPDTAAMSVLDLLRAGIHALVFMATFATREVNKRVGAKSSK